MLSGTGYHDFHRWARREQRGAQGWSPYFVMEWHPVDRIVVERREDFWDNNAYLHKPQHKTLEIIRTPEDAARYALLASSQADFVVNVPSSVAKDPRRPTP